MTSKRDVWSGVDTRGNPLLRAHINHCRKKMRQWTKQENQLRLELKGGEPARPYAASSIFSASSKPTL